MARKAEVNAVEWMQAYAAELRAQQGYGRGAQGPKRRYTADERREKDRIWQRERTRRKRAAAAEAAQMRAREYAACVDDTWDEKTRYRALGYETGADLIERLRDDEVEPRVGAEEWAALDAANAQLDKSAELRRRLDEKYPELPTTVLATTGDAEAGGDGIIDGP